MLSPGGLGSAQKLENVTKFSRAIVEKLEKRSAIAISARMIIIAAAKLITKLWQFYNSPKSNVILSVHWILDFGIETHATFAASRKER